MTIRGSLATMPCPALPGTRGLDASIAEWPRVPLTAAPLVLAATLTLWMVLR